MLETIHVLGMMVGFFVCVMDTSDSSAPHGALTGVQGALTTPVNGRDPKTGRFVKGCLPGPGWKHHPRNFLTEFVKELTAVEKIKKKTFLRHRWEVAFRRDAVASDMMAYLLPKPRPADLLEPPDLIFHQPEQVQIIQHAHLSFGPTNGK